MCALMFCINSQCCMPLHTLITDVVDGLGGSTQLTRILNRLGICSSADTLARHIQHVTSVKENNTLERHFSSEALTFISADNIDFLHSYAQVFCGNQQSSWHGTTVQAVQTTPSIMTGSLPSTAPEHVTQSHSQGEITQAVVTCDTSHEKRHTQCTISSSLWSVGRKRAAVPVSPTPSVRTYTSPSFCWYSYK